MQLMSRRQLASKCSAHNDDNQINVYFVPCLQKSKNPTHPSLLHDLCDARKYLPQECCGGASSKPL